MLNIISTIAMTLTTWALIAINISLLNKNKRLIDTLKEKNNCIEYLMDILVQHEYFDKNTYKSLYNAAYGYLKNMNYDIDGISFDVIPFAIFETLMKSKGYKRPIDDIFFVDHDEFFLFEHGDDSYVIEVFW